MYILPVTLSQIVNESTSESYRLKLSIFAPKQPEIAADLFLSGLKARGRAGSPHPATAGCLREVADFKAAKMSLLRQFGQRRNSVVTDNYGVVNVSCF